jgi:TolA-binding protein
MPVEAGQVLVVSDGTWKLVPAATGQATPPEPAAGATAAEGAASTLPAEEPGRTEPGAEPTAEAKSAPDRPAPSRRWQALAQAGQYDEALTVAERDGFDATCRSASAADLMTLSEAARLSRHPARARQALVALRDRFPGNAQAATAAFYLGRMTGDREAVAWFRAYLREAPGGALRREASGRLLEALSRSGDTAGATDAARAYLKQYPRGPHAPLAERIVHP